MLVLGSGLSNLSLRAVLTDTVCVWQRFVGFVVTNTIVAGHTSCQAHVTPCVKLSPTLRYITVLPLLEVSAISRIPSSTSRSRLNILLRLEFINFDLLCSKTSQRNHYYNFKFLSSLFLSSAAIKIKITMSIPKENQHSSTPSSNTNNPANGNGNVNGHGHGNANLGTNSGGTSDQANSPSYTAMMNLNGKTPSPFDLHPVPIRLIY